MLHEEVELKWDELQYVIEDFQLLEKLRPSLIVGVSFKFQKVGFSLSQLYDIIVGNYCLYWIASSNQRSFAKKNVY